MQSQNYLNLVVPITLESHLIQIELNDLRSLTNPTYPRQRLLSFKFEIQKASTRQLVSSRIFGTY